MVWGVPEVQEVLKKFVPVADECNVMLWQRGPAEQALWRKIGEQGHYGKPWQGVYATTPSGKLLGSTNQRDARVMIDLLKKALEKWEALDKKERLLESEPAPERPGPMGLYPEGGLVLEVYSRDLPRKDGSESKGFWAGAWNKDYAWFRKDEALSMVPTSREAGARQAAPEKLARRIVKYHLIDNVRGETGPFGDEHVKRAELAAVVTGVEGDLVKLRLEGASLTEERSSEVICGYEAKLLGRATWDAKKEKFTSFELQAAGTRWGSKGWGGGTVRKDDMGPNPMGVAFRLAPTTQGADRVPPAFVFHPLGEKYYSQ